MGTREINDIDRQFSMVFFIETPIQPKIWYQMFKLFTRMTLIFTIIQWELSRDKGPVKDIFQPTSLWIYPKTKKYINFDKFQFRFDYRIAIPVENDIRSV